MRYHASISEKNSPQTYTVLFLSLFRLFKSNAYLKSIFKDFQKLETENEMRTNESLEHHATLVMTTFDDAISNIDNYDYVQDHLHRTGGTHQRFVDFRSDNFMVCITLVLCPVLLL